jgi:CRP/FNR family transcriptional regulator, cyclic AMP receptor protein
MRATPYGFEFFENCIMCKWRSDGFFCDLDSSALKMFDTLAFTNVYPEGAVLFAEEQPVRGVFLVCRGTVKLSISAGDGKTLITHIAQQGEVLGLSSAFTGNPYKSTAETLEPTQVNFVRRDDFIKFVREYQDACVKAASQLGQECESTSDHIRALGLSHSAAEKLAHLLLTWCNERGKPAENGSMRVQLLMTHEDISQLIGTSRETVTRLLKEFRDKGIIAIRGSALTILNKPALEALVLL